MPPVKPIAFIIAVLAAGSIVPFAKLLGALSSPGGDGLDTMWTMVVFLGIVVAVTVVSIVIGFVRKEGSSWLAILAVLLLVGTLWLISM